MKNIIGILRESADKHGEKRTAITPKNAKQITNKGFRLIVEPSVDPETGDIKRAFKDEDYINAGAEIKNDVAEANVIFGLKEISVNKIMPNKTYLFFSHTHKGQVKNRNMLKELVKNKSTLIDYELISDNNNSRLLTAFTYIAGSAGMVDTLWAFGKKLNLKNILNPFIDIKQSIKAENMETVKTIFGKVRNEIIENETPEELPPIICCVLGRGKTSKGAVQILDMLPCEEITIVELENIFKNGKRNKIYKLVLEVYDIYRLKKEYKNISTGNSETEKIMHYINNSEMYDSNLGNILPYITLLMNCIIWSNKYPRVVTKKLIKDVYKEHNTILAIGDVTCDPNGSIEFSKETWIDNPVYNYDPINENIIDGFQPDGITVMAVTNLPCEFSADASEKFSDQLLPFLNEIIFENYDCDFSDSTLPKEIKKAIIMWKGKFTDKYKYMEAFI